jgi:hypothetical protein
MIDYYRDYFSYLWRFTEQWAEKFCLCYHKYCNVFLMLHQYEIQRKHAMRNTEYHSHQLISGHK